MSKDTQPFQRYAAAYDHLYNEKDYEKETSFIEEMITRYSARKVETLLDLGCGTGGHALPLATRGYHITGVDLSQEMLERASAKSTALNVSNKVTFLQSDISELVLEKQFDAVVCMFAVLSYQVTNKKLLDTFRVVRSHLKPGGIFLCDFWYGPAALRDLPTKREKSITHELITIKRTATPTVSFNTNSVDVVYDLETFENDVKVDETTEKHTMRYFFLPELALLASLNGLELVHSCECCTPETPASENTWTVSAVFKG
jgi:ubiquinone/menaquinone biosynthesis C-methylase UbiE